MSPRMKNSSERPLRMVSLLIQEMVDNNYTDYIAMDPVKWLDLPSIMEVKGDRKQSVLLPSCNN